MFSELVVGNTLINNGLTYMDLWRSRKQPADVLELVLSDRLTGVPIQQDQPAQFSFGYTVDGISKAFAGTVNFVDGLTVRIKDGMVSCLRTNIVQAFIEATPQEIISFGLRKAGIKKFSLSDLVFEKKNFIASGENVYELAQNVNRVWGLDFDPYFDVEETFHWHQRPDQEELYSFEYGENIIDIEWDGQLGRILTIGLPFMDHSQLISIDHPEVVLDEALVDTVHSFYDGKKLRTEIYFSSLLGGDSNV